MNIVQLAGLSTWGFTPGWYKSAPLALLLLLALTSAFEYAQTSPQTQTPSQTQPAPAVSPTLKPNHLKIKIINAKTNQPIHDERLNVALRVDQIGSVPMATDKNGVIDVDYGHATTIRILSNMYADCRSRHELYTDYSIITIINNGITTGNLCSDARPAAKPGELILFEIPKTFIPNYPKPPVSNLPHSDENPHAPQN